ncbi:MAG TPA: hypothetical protein VN577_09325 [Terriglobales bacterium]|nr:hypothetical protein [Terriglobales bacterium]
MWWALPLLFLGGVFSIEANGNLSEFDALTSHLKVTYGLMGITAVASVLCGLWLVISLGSHRWAQRLGGIALAAYSIVLIAGTLLTIIPCAGPS